MKKFILYYPIVALLFTLLLFSACRDDNDDVFNIPENVTIWSGPTISFEKVSGSDPSLEANQDRITDNVWITRGNDGGQIYNAVSENSATKETSPAGTLWAEGTTADIDNLSFTNFRTAVEQPQSVVGKSLVLYLTDENIAIDVTFTAWAQGMEGGFAYQRSSN